MIMHFFAGRVSPRSGDKLGCIGCRKIVEVSAANIDWQHSIYTVCGPAALEAKKPRDSSSMKIFPLAEMEPGDKPVPNGTGGLIGSMSPAYGPGAPPDAGKETS